MTSLRQRFALWLCYQVGIDNSEYGRYWLARKLKAAGRD